MIRLTNAGINKSARRIRKYEEKTGDREIIFEFRRFRASPIGQLLALLVDSLHLIPCVVSGRVKRVDSIVRKLRRIRNGTTLTSMDDIVAFRVICDRPSAQYRIIETLLNSDLCLLRCNNKDYISNPRADGYRANHIISDINQTLPNNENSSKYTVETQIRTYYQHLWATMSESFGESVKEGGGSDDVRGYLANLSENIGLFERKNPDKVQINLKNPIGEVVYKIIKFDKGLGYKIGNEDYFGSELGPALDYLKSLEERETDQRYEYVLLGYHTEHNPLRCTHQRYYSPKGIPAIPPEIAGEFKRPETEGSLSSQD